MPLANIKFTKNKAKGTLAPERGLEIGVYVLKMQQTAGTLIGRSTNTLWFKAQKQLMQSKSLKNIYWSTLKGKGKEEIDIL